jgi:quercetin dioxygenase-like cupin family protein
MARIEIVRAADQGFRSGYPTGHCVDGGVRHQAVSPERFSLWLLRAELDDGSTIDWPAMHGDEAVYVLEGALEIDGRVTPTKGAAIVESNVETRARAIGPTCIVHMGPRDPVPPADGLNGAPATDGRGVHVVGPRGTYANTTDTVDSHYYADSTCASCRITLRSVGRTFGYRSEPHRHTQDELIHVVAGGINLGRQHLGPGDTVAIAAGARYGFRGDDDGFVFVNYRRDASQQMWGSGIAPRMEGGIVNDMTPVMDLIRPGDLDHGA